MHIAVCDDNADDIKRVTFFINNRHTYKTFLNPSSLLSSLDDGEHFDLYILDICLGNKNGIELATEIKRYDKDPLICFISASNEFYRDAYNLYVFQYLLKPLSNKAFDDMLSIAEQRLKKCNNYSVILSQKGRRVRIKYENIFYIESQNHTLIFYCKDNRIEKTTGNLGILEKTLDNNIFIRCHQSYILNIYNTDSLEGNLFLCGGTYIPISRKYSHVKERFRQVLFEEMG